MSICLLYGRLSPALVKGVQQTNQMNISRPLLSEITEVIEDTVEYACDQNQISGELMWTVVESLATAKLAELRGELASA